MSNRPSDYEQRQLALDPSASIICEAPAGSGKTELLTQRFLALLARVDYPEEIVAITFTRKAAGEMRERILMALERGMDAQAPASEHQQHTWQLARDVIARDQQLQWHILHNPNRLQVQTFDSLCAKLANALPMHSSFGSPPQVAENAEDFYRQAVRNLLATLEEDYPWSDAIAEILRRLDNNVQRLEALFISMLARREGWLPLIGSGGGDDEALMALQHSLQQVCEDTIAKVRDAIPEQLHRPLLGFAAHAAHNLRGQASPLEACETMDVDCAELPSDDDEGLRQWHGLLHLLLKSDNDWRKSLDKRVGFPAGENAAEKREFREVKQRCLAMIGELQNVDGLLELLHDVQALPSTEYSDDQVVLLQALTQLLPILSAYLTLVFREQNTVDFSEISIKARMALGSVNQHAGEIAVSELALKLDYRIQHVLIDEFQDTSPSQVELLEQLTLGWTPGDGRTLFCVGDAMQSIYGFRGANVGLFIRCIQFGLGHIPLQPIRLTTNFRSQAGVVNWINQVFAQAFPARSDISDGAVHYSPSIAFQPALPERAVEADVFLDGYEKSDEAQQVLSIIQQVKQETPQASVAILVRNRNHVAHITPLLQQYGIKYRAVDLEPLAENAMVQDLVSLVHALLDPADRVAWLSVLRAPWCGLSLRDLDVLALREDDTGVPLTVGQQAQKALEEAHASAQQAPTQEDMFAEKSEPVECTANHGAALSNDGCQRLSRVLPILLAYVEQRQRKSLRQWVEGAWIALGGAACARHPSDLKNADLFFDLLARLDTHAALAQRYALRDALGSLFAVPDPEADDSLQIMTIHKSKGLEFDVVIVPGLDRQPRGQDPELLRWYERIAQSGETHLLMAPLSVAGQEKDSVYQHLAKQEKKKTQFENCRLLYVACTRAKQRLHLLGFGKQSDNEEQRFRQPSKASLLAPIWQPLQVLATVHRCDEVSEGDVDLQERSPRPILRLPANWSNPELPSRHALDDYIPFYQHNNQEEGDNQPVFEREDPVARHVGTLVHRVIEQIGHGGERLIALLQSADADQRRMIWRSKLLALGTPHSAIPKALALVEMGVNSVLQDERLIAMLQTPVQQRFHEYAVTLNTNKGPQAFVIDLLLTLDDETWIVDFKTSQPAKQQSLESFLAQEKASYARVMQSYQRAVVAMNLPNVRSLLYFPLAGAWIEM